MKELWRKLKKILAVRRSKAETPKKLFLDLRYSRETVCFWETTQMKTKNENILISLFSHKNWQIWTYGDWKVSGISGVTISSGSFFTVLALIGSPGVKIGASWGVISDCIWPLFSFEREVPGSSWSIYIDGSISRLKISLFMNYGVYIFQRGAKVNELF